MKFEKLNEWLKFDLVNKVYTKEVSGYQVYFGHYPYFILQIPCFCIPIKGKISKPQLEAIVEKCLQNECFIRHLDDESDLLYISLPTGKMEQKLADISLLILKVAIEKLKEFELHPLSCCIHCHKEAEYLTISNDYLPLHEHCKEELKKEKEALFEKEKKDKKKCILGILFPLLFGLIGILPIAIGIYVFHLFITPLQLFIPIGIFMGYVLSKNSQRKWLNIYCFILGAVFILGVNGVAFPYLASVSQLSLLEFIKGDWWFSIRKILFSFLFIFGGYRLGTLYFLRKVPNYEKILKDF